MKQGRETRADRPFQELIEVRRRRRQQDDLATPTAVRAVLDELRARCPALRQASETEIIRLLRAVRHVETWPATDTRRGRPGAFPRDLLLETSRQLRAILEHDTGGRISVQTFVGHYLPIPAWPEDVVAALERGDLNRMEAAQVARLTPQRLGLRRAQAAKFRRELVANHARAGGSQPSLRARVRELLGELPAVTSGKMSEAVQMVDDLLRVNPADNRHLFYEQMKDFFFALRDIRPEEIDDATLDLLTRRADELMEVIHSIHLRRRQREKTTIKFHL